MEYSKSELATFDPPSYWPTSLYYNGNAADSQVRFQTTMLDLTHTVERMTRESLAVFQGSDTKAIYVEYTAIDSHCHEQRNELAVKNGSFNAHLFGADRRNVPQLKDGQMLTFFFDARYRSTGTQLLNDFLAPLIVKLHQHRYKTRNANAIFSEQDDFSKIEVSFVSDEMRNKDIYVRGLIQRWMELVQARAEHMENGRLFFDTRSNLDGKSIYYVPATYTQHSDGRTDIGFDDNNRYTCHWVVVRQYLKDAENEWVPSTCYMTWYPQHTTDIKLRNRDLSLQIMRDHARVAVGHTHNNVLDKLTRQSALLYRDCVVWKSELGAGELERRVRRYMHHYANTMRVARGNGSITDVHIKALMLFQNRGLPKYNDVTPDLFALRHPLVSHMEEHADQLFVRPVVDAEKCTTVASSSPQTSDASSA